MLKSSLVRVNQNRNYRIFEEYAFYLVSDVRKKCSIDIFKFDGNVYAFDSTIVDLYLVVFWLAKFRNKNGDIKVHTLYDMEAQIPTFFHITAISTTQNNEHNTLRNRSYYIFDCAYNRFRIYSV